VLAGLAWGAPRVFVPGHATWSLAEAVVLRERRLHKAAFGLSVEAPAGWGFSTQTGYPAVAFLLLHPDGSRLSVSVTKTHASSSAAFVEENVPALRLAHFAVVRASDTTNGARLLELKPEKGSSLVKQIYAVRRNEESKGASRDGGSSGAGGTTTALSNDGLVVTLTTQEGLASAHDGDLFNLAASVTFDDAPQP